MRQSRKSRRNKKSDVVMEKKTEELLNMKDENIEMKKGEIIKGTVEDKKDVNDKMGKGKKDDGDDGTMKDKVDVESKIESNLINKNLVEAQKRVQNITSEGDKGEQGTPIPDKPVTEVHDTPSSLARPEIVNIEPESMTILNLADLKGEDVTKFETRNGFTSNMSYELSVRTETPTFYTIQTNQIGDLLTEKVESMSRFELYWKVMMDNLYRVEDVTTTLNIDDIKVTANPGFDYMAYYRSLSSLDQATVRERFARLANARANDNLRYDRVISIMTLPEHQLFELMQEVISSEEREWKYFNDFMTKGWTTEFEDIRKLDAFVDQRFAYTARPARQNKIIEFILKNPNFIGLYVDMMRGLLQDEITVASKNAVTTIDRLLGSSQIETFRIDRTISMVGAIKSSHVNTMMQVYALKKFLGPMVHVRMRFTPEVFMLEQIFASILIRWFPRTMFTEETRNLADNTFFLQIINPGWIKKPRTHYDLVQVREGSINLIEKYGMGKEIPDAIREYFSIRGWVDSEDYEPVVVDARFVEYLDTYNGIHFVPWQGRWKELYESVPIIGKTIAMYEVIPTAIQSNTQASRFLKSMLRVLCEGMASFGNLTYMMDHMLRSLRGMPTYPMIHNMDPEVLDSAREIDVDLMAPVSMLYLIEPVKMNVRGIDFRPWKFGQIANEWVTQLATVYHIIRTALPLKLYKKRTILEMISKYLTIKLPIFNKMLERLLMPPVKDTLNMPEPDKTHWIWKAYYGVKKIVEENHHDYGWQSEFYLLRNSETKNDGSFVAYEWTYNNQPITAELNRDQLARNVVEGFSPTADAIQFENVIIKVNVPVRFMINQYLMRPTQDIEQIFNTTLTNRSYELGVMFYGWTDRDNTYDYERRDNPFKRPPIAVVGRPRCFYPGVSIEFPLEFVRYYDVRNESWRLFTLNDWVRYKTMDEVPS
jgi:hypothetical protein